MSIELTVIVKGVDGKLVKGADVSVAPGKATGTTDANGETTVKIDGASRYQVTVSAGGDSQTVPFYATSEQTARLEVDLAYFKHLNQTAYKTATTKTTAATPTPWYRTTDAFIDGGILLVLLIALVIVIGAVRQATRRKDGRRHVKH